MRARPGTCSAARSMARSASGVATRRRACRSTVRSMRTPWEHVPPECAFRYMPRHAGLHEAGTECRSRQVFRSAACSLLLWSL